MIPDRGAFSTDTLREVKAHFHMTWDRTISDHVSTRLGNRNVWFLLLVLATVVWFREPLTSVLSLSLQSDEYQHYSHISLIPFLCLYLLYLRRAAISASVEWSPLLGSILMVIGGAVVLVGNEPTSGKLASLSPAMLSFVTIFWRAFLSC